MVPQDIRWGRTYEGFSENPDVVKVLGEAANRGLQRARLDDPLAVLACAKHYMADGGTTFGTGVPRGGSQRFGLDQGDTRADEATLRKIHLPGYAATVAGCMNCIAGAGSILGVFLAPRLAHHFGWEMVFMINGGIYLLV